MRWRLAALLTCLCLAPSLASCSGAPDAYIDYWSPGTSDTIIVVTVTSSTCDRLDGPVAKETATDVIIQIRLHPTTGKSCPTITPVANRFSIVLRDPVGNRKVRGPTQPNAAEFIESPPPLGGP